MRLVGVAIGVRNAAAAATATLMSTGLGEMPMLFEAATAMGMMIRAVAVLLISCPKIPVRTKSPASKAYGPEFPTMLTSPSAIFCAAPVLTMAVESGIIAPTSITVVQSIAR